MPTPYCVGATNSLTKVEGDHSCTVRRFGPYVGPPRALNPVLASLALRRRRSAGEARAKLRRLRSRSGRGRNGVCEARYHYTTEWCCQGNLPSEGQVRASVREPLRMSAHRSLQRAADRSRALDESATAARRELWDAMKEARADGMTLQEIADTCGLSRQRVMEIVRS